MNSHSPGFPISSATILQCQQSQQRCVSLVKRILDRSKAFSAQFGPQARLKSDTNGHSPDSDKPLASFPRGPQKRSLPFDSELPSSPRKHHKETDYPTSYQIIRPSIIHHHHRSTESYSSPASSINRDLSDRSRSQSQPSPSNVFNSNSTPSKSIESLTSPLQLEEEIGLQPLSVLPAQSSRSDSLDSAPLWNSGPSESFAADRPIFSPNPLPHHKQPLFKEASPEIRPVNDKLPDPPSDCDYDGEVLIAESPTGSAEEPNPLDQGSGSPHELWSAPPLLQRSSPPCLVPQQVSNVTPPRESAVPRPRKFIESSVRFADQSSLNASQCVRKTSTSKEPHIRRSSLWKQNLSELKSPDHPNPPRTTPKTHPHSIPKPLQPVATDQSSESTKAVIRSPPFLTSVAQLPDLEERLKAAISGFIPSWRLGQLVTALIKLNRHQQAISGLNLSTWPPISTGDFRACMTIPDDTLLYKMQRPQTLSEFLEFASCKKLIHLSGNGSDQTIQLTRDYTPLGLIFHPLIKALREIYTSSRQKKASSVELSKVIEPRLQVPPSLLVPAADTLYKYVQAAEADGIVEIETKGDKTFVGLRPSWWSALNIEKPENSAVEINVNQFKICHFCQEKGHLIKLCPKLQPPRGHSEN